MRRSMADLIKTGLRRIAPACFLLVLYGLILGSAPPARAQTWNGSVSDLWSNASNWTPNTSPNSSSATVVINTATNNPVVLDISPTIGTLSLGSSSNTLDMSSVDLTVAGSSISNGGQINVGVSSSAILYVDSSSLTLSGGGTVTLGNANSEIAGYSGTSNTLVNQSTINGQGFIYNVTLNNSGTVNANVSGGTLYIYSAPTTNTGTLQATGGGTLEIYSSTVTNTGGTISTDSSSSVIIDSSTVTGGNLTSTGAGVIHGESATLNGVTITAGSTFSSDAANSNYLTGNLTNNGSVLIGGSGGASNLYIEATTLNLSGTGTVTLNNANSEIAGYSGTSNTLVNQTTINGQGYIYDVTLTNSGTVNANVSGGTLEIDSAPTTNTGTLQATGGGTLEIIYSTVTNTGGTISTDGSSSVIINDSTITGGSLTAAAGGVIHGESATLNGVTITTGSTFSSDAGYSNYLTGNLTNNGSVLIGGTGGYSNLYIEATTVTLSGSGTVTLNNANSEILGYSGVAYNTLVNPLTINGQGTIYDVTFSNSGTVNANVSGGTLEIDSAPTTNTGTLQATGGGTLEIIYTTVTNTGGTISTDGTSSVLIYDSTITGGNLTAAAGGVIHSESSTFSGVTLTSGTTFSSDAGYSNYLTGNLTNNGTVLIGSSGGYSNLYIEATTLNLSGSGTVTLGNANSEILGYNGTSNTLVNSLTINGQGTIYDLTFSNSGTVNANVSGGTLAIDSAPTTNTGTLQATGGGTLEIIYTTVTNTGGTISTDGTSSVLIYDSTITGGNLTSTGAGVIHSESSTLSGVTLTSGTTFSSDAGYSNYLTGNLTNNGSVLIGGTGGASNLYVEASSATISGTGTVTLNNANSYIEGYSGYAYNTLVNQSTINGQGYIYDVTLNNQGTIDANVSGGTLYIYAAPTTNSGILRADAGATLDLTNSTLTNFASTGSSAGTLTGGTYEVFSGTFKFNNGGFTSDIVTNAATILLDGAAGAPKFLDQSGNNALANFSTNAAAGSFTIQNGVSITTSSSGFSNAGIVNIGANSTLTVGGANDYVQTGGTTTLLTGTSNLAVASGHNFDLNGGTLQGIGTITGNLVNAGGTVSPGLPGTIGTLTVTGNYSDPQSFLDIQIGHPGSSLLDIGGTANLTGTTLDVSLLNGFTPMNGASYLIMETGGLTGMFTDPVIHDGNITFTEANIGNNVYLDVSVSSIPEPASVVLMSLGLAGAGAYAVVRKRRQARRA